MNEDLEMYLMQVARQLRGLPTKQREAELREIESHLRAMIEAREVGGVLYSKAVNDSLQQFGSAQRVGRDLTRIWHQGREENPWRALGAALIIATSQLALICACNWMTNIVHISLLMHAVTPGQPLPSWGAACMRALECSYVLTPLACGWLASRVAPRRATLVVAVTYLCVLGAMYAVTVDAQRDLLENLLNISLPSLALPIALWGAHLGKKKQTSSILRRVLPASR